MESEKHIDIQFLLRELSIVKKKYEYKYNEAEKFNVFKALHKWNDERRLHSRFLSVLLNPKGSHGKGNIFLGLFLKKVEIDLGKLDNLTIFPNEIDKKEYRDIDILIVNRKRNKALIIENKIHASDSNNYRDGQLERYYNRMLNEGIQQKKLHTIYLTLDGSEPSYESLGEYWSLENINGKCISYETEIIKWLDECLKEVVDLPFIRESIIQYKKLILEMTDNETDIEHRKELIRVIGGNQNNLSASRQLFENYKHIKWHTVSDFWNELSLALKKEGYSVMATPTNEDITAITHYEVYKKGQRVKQQCYIALQLENGMFLEIRHNAEEWLFLGCLKEDVKGFVRKIKQEIKELPVTFYSNDDWVFWKPLLEGEERRISLSEFTLPGTFSLINPKYRKMIISEIIGEIKIFTNLLKHIKLEKS